MFLTVLYIYAKFTFYVSLENGLGQAKTKRSTLQFCLFLPFTVQKNYLMFREKKLYII